MNGGLVVLAFTAGFVLATVAALVATTMKHKARQIKPVSDRRLKRLTILDPTERPHVRVMQIQKGDNEQAG